MTATSTQDRSITIGGYTFDEANHVHKLDGKPLTGVTTVLGVINKPALIQWSANQVVEYIKGLTGKWDEAFKAWIVTSEDLDEAKYAHKKKKESAGEIGSEAHDIVEQYIKTGITKVSPNEKVNVMVKNFIDWAVLNKVKFLESEKHVHSKEMWVGGICDLVMEIKGKIYVGDIKTSSGIYPEAFFQTAAYSAMLKETGGYTHFDGLIVINLKKTGGFEYKFNYDVEGNLNAFKAALTLYRQLNAIK